jgi:hypothetical protein
MRASLQVDAIGEAHRMTADVGRIDNRYSVSAATDTLERNSPVEADHRFAVGERPTRSTRNFLSVTSSINAVVTDGPAHTTNDAERS